VNPAFWRLLGEIVRFNRLAKQALDGEVDPNATLQTFLDQHGFTPFFARHYILPMGAAIWSSSLQEMKRFPLPLFYVSSKTTVCWISPIARSGTWCRAAREYIRAMLDKLGDRLTLHLNSPVQRVSRHEDGVTLQLENGSHTFDQVIFACHSASALAMLDDPTPQSARCWAISAGSATRWFCTAIRAGCRCGRAWASWNYRLSAQEQASACVTYNMNILQGLPAGSPLFCVTLNPDAPVDERFVLQRFVYEHPLFNPQSWRAQARRGEINGHQRSWFCGAYWYNGFHEDGVRSALDVVNAIAAGEGN
jgi:predicted NAD/FAD-binding protein